MRRREFVAQAAGALAAGQLLTAEADAAQRGSGGASITLTEAQLEELQKIAKMLQTRNKDGAVAAAERFKKDYGAPPRMRLNPAACTICSVCAACGPTIAGLVGVDGLLGLLE